MQITIKTTPEDRQAAIERVTLFSKISKIGISATLLLLAICYTISFTIVYGNTAPNTIFIPKLVLNPLLWAIFLTLIIIFSKNNNQKLLQANYLNGFANYHTDYNLEITPQGICCYNGEQQIGVFTYSCFTSLEKTSTHLFLLQAKTVLFIIPLTCIPNKTEANEIADFLQNKIDLAQDPFSPKIELTPPQEKVIAKFDFSLNFALDDQMAKDKKQTITSEKYWLFSAIISTIAGYSACIILGNFAISLSFLPIIVLVMLILYIGVGVSHYKAFSPINKNFTPLYYNIPTTFTIASEGIRVYNTKMEVFINWQQPFAVIKSSSGYMVTLNGSFFAYIPYTFANKDLADHAIQYILDENNNPTL